MAQKLSDAEVGQIRQQAADGRSAGDLADAFGVSRRHIGRIIRGDIRQQLGGLNRDIVSVRGVRAAVEAFVSDLDLGLPEQVLAQTAVVLASKLDDSRSSEFVGMAQASPSLARELVEVVAELRGDREPDDALSELKRRREARLLAQSAAR